MGLDCFVGKPSPSGTLVVVNRLAAVICRVERQSVTKGIDESVIGKFDLDLDNSVDFDWSYGGTVRVIVVIVQDAGPSPPPDMSWKLAHERGDYCG